MTKKTEQKANTFFGSPNSKKLSNKENDEFGLGIGKHNKFNIAKDDKPIPALDSMKNQLKLKRSQRSYNLCNLEEDALNEEEIKEVLSNLALQ